MHNNYQGFWKVVHLHQKFMRADLHRWINVEAFTLQWFILLALLILPWIIWVILKDKTKLFDIVLIGALCTIPTTFLDSFGMDIDFWYYPTELIPWSARAIPFDFSMIPVAFMLIYQYFPKWKSYIRALITMAILFAFVAEPFCHYLQLVYYIKWHYMYSFIYYIILGIFIKGIVFKLKRHGDGSNVS